MQEIEKPEYDNKLPTITCPDRNCPDNLFGYCQSEPDLDETGKCKKIFRSKK